MNNSFVGKLVYANAAGIPMIFLNDFQANEDLINASGDRYGDKPNTVMLNELCNGKYMASVRTAPLPTTSSRFSCRLSVRTTPGGCVDNAGS